MPRKVPGGLGGLFENLDLFSRRKRSFVPKDMNGGKPFGVIVPVEGEKFFSKHVRARCRRKTFRPIRSRTRWLGTDSSESNELLGRVLMLIPIPDDAKGGKCLLQTFAQNARDFFSAMEQSLGHFKETSSDLGRDLLDRLARATPARMERFGNSFRFLGRDTDT